MGFLFLTFMQMNRLNEAYALCHVSVDVFLLILIRLRSCGKEKEKKDYITKHCREGMGCNRLRGCCRGRLGVVREGRVAKSGLVCEISVAKAVIDTNGGQILCIYFV